MTSNSTRDMSAFASVLLSLRTVTDTAPLFSKFMETYGMKG